VGEIYDRIGRSYISGRRTDPKIAAQLHSFLEGAESILNIGAGTGSYEPQHSKLIAVEPSATMIQQRPQSSAPVIQASAESLPFDYNQFTHCMTVLSMHHWSDRAKAFSEIKRVTQKRFVALSWYSPGLENKYWLYRDYLTQIPELNSSIFPTVYELKVHFPNLQEHIVPIPYDCLDGFDGAYWKRPEAFLDPDVRKNMSVFSKIKNIEPILDKLKYDIESGNWIKRNQKLLQLSEYDCGYRIFVADLD
jgi:SAM-dependent methyltransferase